MTPEHWLGWCRSCETWKPLVVTGPLRYECRECRTDVRVITNAKNITRPEEQNLSPREG